MKKILSFLTLFIFISFSAKKESKDTVAIKKTIIGFLQWHKKQNDTTANYSLIREQAAGNQMKMQLIDMDGVNQYLAFLKGPNFLSDTFINNLRGYFLKIDNQLQKNPPIDDSAIVKIDGLDLDIPLQSFEPELLLDHLEGLLIKKIVILSNKSIVQVEIQGQPLKPVFELSKINGIWLIDDIGYD